MAFKITCEELEGWLRNIKGKKKSGLPGKFKEWIYQHEILPKILWSLLLHEFSIPTIAELESRVRYFLRKWQFDVELK